MGIPELTASILNEGTKNYTTEQISAELEKLGSSISFSGGKSQNSINVSCLKKNLDATLKLLEEKILNPGFRPEDFKLAKKQYKESVKNDKTSPSAMANKAFNQALYGSSSILGLDPTVKSIENIELQDLKDYYANCYSSSVANMVIVGNITEAEIMPKLEFINKMSNKEVNIQPIPEPAAKTEQQFFIQDKT